MKGYQLSHEDFFIRLTALFDACRDKNHGSVFLTQKRLSYGQNVELPEASGSLPFNDLNLSKSLPILIRATNGRSSRSLTPKIKLSTVVEASDLNNFFARYMEICKLGTNKMKKRDRTKAKEKLKVKRKQIAAASKITVKNEPK
ncbi:hypothetical protein HI914_06522 [Erysiphe necator]|nr:hypothetical protein HI914_06522 [Erysiphe necator]